VRTISSKIIEIPMSKKLENELEIDVRILPAGVFLRIKASKNRSETLNFIKSE
jgi:hypothetical protein